MTTLQISTITRQIFIRFFSRRRFATLAYSRPPLSRMAHLEQATQQAMAAALTRLIGAKAESKKTDVEFIHVSTPSWPLDPSTAVGLTSPAEWRAREKRPIRISVLDSSFNPPTKAHLALASSVPPPSRVVQTSPQRVSRKAVQDQFSSGATSARKDDDQGLEMSSYDARMLLLSVTNADKKLKHGDATYQERLEMMVLLAQEMKSSQDDALSLSFNICVAAIDEPTFVGKSRKLKRAVARKLASLSSHGIRGEQHIAPDSETASPSDSTIASWEKEITLFFLLGFDTVIRLFDSRFYGSTEAMRESLRSFFAPCADGGDGSYVVCARRQQPTKKDPGGNRDQPGSKEGNSDSARTQNLISEVSEEELRFFTSPEVEKYWETGKITLMDDLGVELQAMSSTLARNARSSREFDMDMEVRRLLPGSVANYVFQRNLYSDLRT